MSVYTQIEDSRVTVRELQSGLFLARYNNANKLAAPRFRYALFQWNERTGQVCADAPREMGGQFYASGMTARSICYVVGHAWACYKTTMKRAS